MKKLFLLTLLALAFPASALAQTNYYPTQEHWPTDVCGLDIPIEVRCIHIQNHTGYGRDWIRYRLRPALNDFNTGSWRFRWVLHSRPYLDLNTDEGKMVASEYTRSIVIGRGGPSGPGDWASTHQPDTMEHTDLCIMAIDNRTRASVEHELGHCVGLIHWSLIGAYDDCEVFSVMCGLGDEYNRLAPQDFKTLDFLYGHWDD